MTSSQERRPRVVLADDYPSLLMALGRLLRRSCDVVATAPSGQAALDAVTRLQPDVLVVDLMMCDLDGLEVCRRVKQTVPETDVVLVTAYDDAPIREAALRHGASGFVVKHAAPETLEGTILRIVAERRRAGQR